MKFRILALASMCLLAFADPQADWQKKWDAAVKNAAKEHAGLAKVAWSKKLHEVAFQENTRAVALDPSNSDAEKALGKVLDAGVWVDDPKATVKKKNEGKDADIEAAKTALDEKRRPAFAKVVKELEGVGEFAAKNKLADEEKKTWKLVLEYDPDNEKARKGLGYEKQDGRWVPPEDVAKRNEGKKKIAAADEGEPVQEESDLEKKTGWKLVKRRSAHFFVQTSFSESETKELVRCAEGARAAFLEMFELEKDMCDGPVEMDYFKTKEEHRKFVDTCDDLRQEKGHYYDTGGMTLYSPMVSEAFMGGGDFGYMKDICTHDTIHECWYMWGGFNAKPWWDEGLAYWFSNTLLKTAETHCIEFALSGGGAGNKSWDNVLDWKGLIKDMLREGADPDCEEVMNGSINTLNAKKGCKAWSLVDYILTARKKEFFQFRELMQQEKKQEDALKEAFGVTGYKDFNDKWKEWVLKNY